MSLPGVPAGRPVPRRERLGMAAVLLLAAGLAVFGVRESFRVWHMRQEIRTLERTTQDLAGRQKQLEAEAARLRTDPGYIEKLAREEMGMVREGDRVLKFPSQQPPR